MKHKDRFLKLGSVITFAIMILVNILSNMNYKNLKSVAEVSRSYPNLLTPADFTFLIWAVIYTLLLFFTLYQLEVIKGGNIRYKEDMLHMIRIVFITTNLLNAGWIFAWICEYMALSVMLSTGILIALYICGNLLKKEYLTLWERILIKLPFSLYFGWMTVATAINIVVLMISTGFSGLGVSEELWLVVLILLVTSFAAYRTVKNRDIIYCLSILWGYFGCVIQHISANGWKAAYPRVIAVMLLGSAVLLGCVVYLLTYRKTSL